MICINNICISFFQLLMLGLIISVIIYLYQKLNDQISLGNKYLEDKIQKNEEKILTNAKLYTEPPITTSLEYNPDTFAEDIPVNTLQSISTRYIPPTTQVGMLYKYTIVDETIQPGTSDDSVVLPLFGRQTYSGSSKWIYYSKLNDAIIPIYYKDVQCNKDFGCSELYTDDIIQIPALNGNFKVHMNDNEKY